LIETIPEGFKAEELNSATGNFIFENGKIRIIWLTMPEGDSYKAEYRLIHTGSNSGTVKLNGKFHYVKNDKRLEISLPAFKVVIKKVAAPKEVVRLERQPEIEVPVEAVVDTTEKAASGVESDTAKVNIPKTVEEPKTVIESVIEEPKTVVETLKVEVKKEEPVDAGSGLFFKVQLGAYSSEKPKSTFGNLPEIHFVKTGKIYKYYSGKFTNEADARVVIPEAKAQGFTGAFLVRFKDGKRI
jgi:hypothetical protein